MPKAKSSSAPLPPLMLKYLATGDRSDPGAPSGARADSGEFEAFLLDGKFSAWSRFPRAHEHLADVAVELAELWAQHHVEIEAAAPVGYAPYIWSMLLECERMLAEQDAANPRPTDAPQDAP